MRWRRIHCGNVPQLFFESRWLSARYTVWCLMVLIAHWFCNQLIYWLIDCMTDWYSVVVVIGRGTGQFRWRFHHVKTETVSSERCQTHHLLDDCVHARGHRLLLPWLSSGRHGWTCQPGRRHVRRTLRSTRVTLIELHKSRKCVPAHVWSLNRGWEHYLKIWVQV